MIRSTSVVACLAALLLVLPCAAAQEADWAALLTDAPALAAGDRDAVAHQWLDALDHQPRHPLAGAALALLAAVTTDLCDPAALRARLVAFDGSRLAPQHQAAFARLAGRARAADASQALEAFPQLLSQFWVLGPLGPLQDDLALAIAPELLADPGLDSEHDGPSGSLRWRPLPRASLAERVEPDGAVDGSVGYVMLAAVVHVPGGGPAYIELDLADPASDDDVLDAPFGYGGSSFRGPVLGGTPSRFPGFALGLAGGEQWVTELHLGDRSFVQRQPVVLADGRNVILLKLPLGTLRRPALTLLAADGSALTGWTSESIGEASSHALGLPVDAQPPAAWPVDPAHVMGSRPDASPHERALSGLLLALDGQPADGLALLNAAADSHPGAGLSALASGVVARCAYLPSRVRAARARELAERALQRDPSYLSMGIAGARTLLGEDRDEAAIALLRQLSDEHPAQPFSLLMLAQAYAGLDMDVQAGRAVQEALARSPHSPAVLGPLLHRTRGRGLAARALEIQARLLRESGASAPRLAALARNLLDLGRVEEGLARWAQALQYDAGRSRLEGLAGSLLRLDRLDAARELLTALAVDDPSWAAPRVGLADVARLSGDRAIEERWLVEAQRLRPGIPALRERLFDLTGRHPARDDAEALGLDAGALLASRRGGDGSESVVRILDEAVITLFEDGSAETVTHELVELRDLAACEQRGTLRLDGDVLEVAVVKPDGTRYEPARVGGEYVMPNLAPGDVLDTRVRTNQGSPLRGVHRPGAWFFLSGDEPFLVSRYVIVVPRSLQLRLVQRHFEGEHQQVEREHDIVHRFETRDGERVALEAGAPPGPWFLPWVEFGTDSDLAGEIHHLQLQWLPQALPTPEIALAAAQVASGSESQAQIARDLHAFVNEHLLQRGSQPNSAVSSLLAREGNPTLLYRALLASAGIEAELIFSRGVSPEADPEPDPAFVEPGRLARRLLVRVRPDDGPEAWCDLSQRGLPYGALLGDASGAEALALEQGVLLREPAQPAPGTSFTLKVVLAQDGSAQVEGGLELLGSAGHLTRAQLAEVPDAWHRGVVQSMASGFVPGLDLTSHELQGLHDESGGPFVLRFSGRVPRMLDGSLSCALPLAPSRLSERLAVEGQRRLPFLSTGVGSERSEVLLELPPGLSLAELPPGLLSAAHGWSYQLSSERLSDGSVSIVRTGDRLPFHVEASGFAELVSHAARVDATERARLRFQKLAGAPSGSGGRR